MGKLSDPEVWEYSLGDEYDTTFFLPLLSLLLSLGDAEAEALDGEPIEPPAAYTLGELTSLSNNGKDAAGKGVNLDCLCGAAAAAAAAPPPAAEGWNPSQPVVPPAGKYITGVVAPDLLPLAADAADADAAAAAAHPPFPNPAILLRLLPPPPPPLAPSRALAAPDPKDASDAGRLLSSEVRGAWWWWWW